jgi:signal transduction histidine kinase/DNA-binding response OmpR family regulator
MRQLFSLTLAYEEDVVTARQRAAHIASLLGFDASEQTRIATAVSEIVRNAFRYTGGGTVDFSINVESSPQRFVTEVRDRGKGIPHLDDVLSGRYKSSTGMGIGISGARRLLDRFDIRTSSAGTSVTLEKFLPARAQTVTLDSARRLAEQVAERAPRGLAEEIQQQNQELLRALDEVQRKQQELVHLNRELEDTNRGVMALYAELDDKADHLRRADELKSRFLSNMTHEFRTPVNSIIGLCNLLIEDRQRAGRDADQEVLYIRKAAEQLSELVNDLLDLAKVEAGKTVVHVSQFDVESLFGALRGMLRPLLINQSVTLVFDDVEGLPLMRTDEAKVSQILRNLISNALKFTERGEVRVSATVGSDRITFRVSDTGIGIDQADQQRIFEEFTQLEHRLQRNVRGTGLGLPLSKRLAELLGGSLSVKSEPGSGSTFCVSLPIHYRAPSGAAGPTFEWVPDATKLSVLVVDDADDAQYVFQRVLENTRFQIYPARSVHEAESALDAIAPAAVILDLVLGDEDGWGLLERLKRGEGRKPAVVVVVSALPERARAVALGADAFLNKPIDRRLILTTLDRLIGRPEAIRVMVIDDQEIARFVIRQCLPGPVFDVVECESGEKALECIADERPDVVLLDLVLPGMHGGDVLRVVSADAATRYIPVIVVTATALDAADRRRLLEHAVAIISKADLSRETLGEAVRAAAGRLQSAEAPNVAAGSPEAQE